MKFFIEIYIELPCMYMNIYISLSLSFPLSDSHFTLSISPNPWNQIYRVLPKESLFSQKTSVLTTRPWSSVIYCLRLTIYKFLSNSTINNVSTTIYYLIHLNVNLFSINFVSTILKF